MDRFVYREYPVPVICDRDKNSELIVVGIVFLNGSSDENILNNGITHLIEHMVFKGTKKYSAKDISFKVESLGGYINAFTTKEYTCFYIKMIKNNFNKLVDIFFEVCFSAVFNEEEFYKEKDVVSSEIVSIKDNPQEYFSEISESYLYSNPGYCLPIAGNLETLQNIKFKTLIDYWKEYFGKYGYFGVISGNFDDKKLNLIASKLPEKQFVTKKYTKENIKIFEKEFDLKYEQTYLSYFLNLEDINSKDKYAYYLISYMLCESMSSRLFQRLREDLGLCYNINSDVTLYKIGGYLSIDAEIDSRKYEKFNKNLISELDMIYKKGFREKEYRAAKNQILLSLSSNYESLLNRFELNIKQFISENRLITPGEIELKIQNYSLQDLNFIYKKIYDYGITKCKTL